MNPLCPNCELKMTSSNYEFFCPKCGLVIDKDEFQNPYEERLFVQPWRSNLPQTRPSHKWVRGRCIIIGLKD